MNLQHLRRMRIGLLVLLMVAGSSGTSSIRADDKPALHPAPTDGYTTEADLFAVRAIDAKSCVLAGARGQLARSDDGGKTWKALKTETDADLRDVRFVTSQVGLAVGDGGKYPRTNAKTFDYNEMTVLTNGRCFSSVFRTSDGGKTWERVEMGTNLSLMSLAWLGPKRAVLATATPVNAGLTMGDLLVTEDAGKTWNLLLHLHAPAQALALGSEQVGWVVGKQGELPAGRGLTVNGKPVKDIKQLTAEELKGIPFPSRWAMSLPEKWNAEAVNLGLKPQQPLLGTNMLAEAQTLGDKKELNGIHIQGETVWVVGEDCGLYVAERKNKKWQPWRTIPPVADFEKVALRGVAFRDATFGIAVGDTGACLVTRDGGKKWAPQDVGTTQRLNSVAFVGNNVLIVGHSGTLIRLTLEPAK